MRESFITSRRSMTDTRSRISRCFALTSQSIRADGNARASAAATGIACTTSPSAPRRTMRIRDGVAASGTAQPRNQIAGRMILQVADNRRPPAVTAHGRALRDRLHRVVGALAVHVGLDEREQPLDGVVAEHDDVVDAAKRI